MIEKSGRNFRGPCSLPNKPRLVRFRVNPNAQPSLTEVPRPEINLPATVKFIQSQGNTQVLRWIGFTEEHSGECFPSIRHDELVFASGKLNRLYPDEKRLLSVQKRLADPNWQRSLTQSFFSANMASRKIPHLDPSPVIQWKAGWLMLLPMRSLAICPSDMCISSESVGSERFSTRTSAAIFYRLAARASTSCRHAADNASQVVAE